MQELAVLRKQAKVDQRNKKRLESKIAQLEKHGYTLAGYFYLGQDSWMESYYTPLQARFDAFLERNHHSDLAQKVVEAYQAEINFYRQFKAYYSYGFYVAQKNK